MIRISDNCRAEYKSKHIIYNLHKEDDCTLVFKTPLHGKSSIDSAHNFPRLVAERLNKYDRALHVPALIDACRQHEILERERRQKTNKSPLLKRFFIYLPDSIKEKSNVAM